MADLGNSRMALYQENSSTVKTVHNVALMWGLQRAGDFYHYVL